MPPGLTKEELKVYLILKAFAEEQIVYPAEEWELEHFDEGLVDREGLTKILRKMRRMLPEPEAKDVEKRVLLRKYSIYDAEMEEAVYTELEKTFENRNAIEIEYFSMEKGEAIRGKIDIYYKSRKYVVAFCHLRGDMRKFRTSRIVSARQTSEKYEIPEDLTSSDNGIGWRATITS